MERLWSCSSMALSVVSPFSKFSGCANAAATNARPSSELVECCSRMLSVWGRGERVRMTGLPFSVPSVTLSASSAAASD